MARKKKADIEAAEALAEKEQAEAVAAQEKAEKEQAEAAEAAAKVEEMKAEAEYSVAPGCSLTSKRGILGPGVVVTEKDFQAGIETIRNLVKTKHVVLNG